MNEKLRKELEDLMRQLGVRGDDPDPQLAMRRAVLVRRTLDGALTAAAVLVIADRVAYSFLHASLPAPVADAVSDGRHRTTVTLVEELRSSVSKLLVQALRLDTEARAERVNALVRKLIDRMEAGLMRSLNNRIETGLHAAATLAQEVFPNEG
jgi:hypothetical protein